MDLKKPMPKVLKKNIIAITIIMISFIVALAIACVVIYFLAPDIYRTLFNKCPAGTYNAGAFTSCSSCLPGTWSISE